MIKNLLKMSAVVMVSLTANAQNINFNSNELYPEGIAFSKKQNTFFVSSLHYGKIGKVSPKGEYIEFITDKDLISTIGIHANEKPICYMFVFLILAFRLLQTLPRK